MAPVYSPLNDRDLEVEPETKTWRAGFKTRQQPTKVRTMPIVILLLLITNAATVLLYFSNKDTLEAEPTPSDYAKQDSIPLARTWNRFWWNTEYSPQSHNDSDTLWDAVRPSHGFIAIDENEARAQHWPESMRLPSDGSKRVYLLEAYHQIHCLRILQRTFWEAFEGRPYTWHPSKHMTHCFDTLRQAVQCNADSTPLYTFGDFTVGDGQLHRCRDWSQLRDFATRNSACYKDSVDPIPLGEHFGFCDDGSDGLP